MTLSRIILLTIESVLKDEPILGIKEDEISILPEGRVPASMGERWLTVHGHSIIAMTPGQQTRRKRLSFGVSITLRARAIPNDRFNTILYTDEDSALAVLEQVAERVESLTTFQKLEQASSDTYQISKQFIFRTINLDPIHLYPSDFLTRSGNEKEELYDKVAGFRLTALFDSPEYQLTINPLECNS